MMKRKNANVAVPIFGPKTYKLFGAYTYEDAYAIIQSDQTIDSEAAERLKTLYMESGRAEFEQKKDDVENRLLY